MLKAVLWDMGGPIDEEVGYERLIDEDMKRALTEARVTWSEADFREAARWAVDSFASNAYKAMMWKLSSFRVELAEQVYSRWPLVATGGTPSVAGLSCGKGSTYSYGRFIAAERGWGS